MKQAKRLPYTLSAIIVAMLAFVLSVGNIGKLPMNEDEETTAHISSGLGFHYQNVLYAHEPIPLATQPFTPADYWARNTAGRVYRYTLEDNGNSVAYNYLYFLVIRAVGFSLFKARMINVVCYAISGCLLYLIAVYWRSGLLAAWLSWIVLLAQPFVLNNMVIARSYGFSLLLMVACIALVSYLIKGMYKGGALAMPILLSAAFFLLMTLTHYFNAVFVACSYAFLLRLSLKQKRYGKWILLSIVLYGIGITIWMLPLKGINGLEMVGQMKEYMLRGDNSYQKMILDNPLHLIYPVLCTWATVIGFQAHPDGSVHAFLAIAFILLPVALVYYAWRRAAGTARTMLLYLLGSVAAYILFACGSSLLGNSLFIFYDFRFWVVLAPFVALLIGWGLSVAFADTRHLLGSNKGSILKANQTLLSIGLLSIASLLLLRYLLNVTLFTSATIRDGSNILTTANEDYAVAAESIVQTYSATDTVVYKNWRIAENINLYLEEQPKIIQRVDASIAFDVQVVTVPGKMKYRQTITGHPNIYGRN